VLPGGEGSNLDSVSLQPPQEADCDPAGGTPLWKRWLRKDDENSQVAGFLLQLEDEACAVSENRTDSGSYCVKPVQSEFGRSNFRQNSDIALVPNQCHYAYEGRGEKRRGSAPISGQQSKALATTRKASR
jgi:hypothetical protein